MRTVSRVAAVLTSLVLAVGLGGCGDGPPADEVQRDHQDAAAAAQQEIEAQLAPLAGVGKMLGSATRDTCETGQHNAKIDDPYDVRCTVEVHRAYRVTGADFRAAADSVTDTFPECADSDAEETLTDYWDKLRGTQTHNFEGPYRPDYLPSYRLDCDEAGAEEQDADAPVRVSVTDWATLPADEETLDLHEHAMGRPCANSTETRPCEWDGVPARNILESDAADEGWIVFVEGSQEYARTT